LNNYYVSKEEVQNGEYINLISSLNNAARYFGSIEYFCALAVMFSFFRALELLQFSMEMNLPVATLRAGIGDIVNWLVILVFLLYGFSMTGYMVYCTSVEEFATV